MDNSQIEKSGFVYIMSNPSMPGLIKVGCTARNPILRTKDDDMSSTGIPAPFIVEYFVWFDNMWEAEKLSHKALEKYHHGKEFFKIDVAIAIYKIENLGIKYSKLFSKPAEEEKVKIIIQNKVEESTNLFEKAENYKINHYKENFDIDESIKKYDDYIKFATSLLRSYPKISYIFSLQKAYKMSGVLNLKKLKIPEIEEDSSSVINIVDESVKLFKKALDISQEGDNNDDAVILHLIGIAYAYVNSNKKAISKEIIMEYHEKSIEYHQKSIVKNPNYIGAYEMLAGRYNSYQYDFLKKKKAIGFLEKVKKLNPSMASKYNSKIQLIKSEINDPHKKNKAIEVLINWIEIYPDKKEYYCKVIKEIDPEFDIEKHLPRTTVVNKKQERKKFLGIF